MLINYDEWKNNYTMIFIRFLIRLDLTLGPFIMEWGGNLLSFLLRCGTRPYEWGTQ